MEGAKGQEGERGKIPTFTTSKFKDLFHEIDTAQLEKKFLFIADLTGKAGTATSYGKCQYFGLHGEQKKVTVQKTQK